MTDQDAVTASQHLEPPSARAAAPSVVRRLRTLSDRGVAALFIAPTLFLLLAINIFPLGWTIYLSFTNFRANRPGAPVSWVGLDNYRMLLNDPEIWDRMQTTAHFLFWTLSLQVVLGLGLALLINRRFRGHGFWTNVIIIPMMLSPAVVGTFWKYLYQPQSGIFNAIVNLFADAGAFSMIGSVELAPWAIVIVDTWMWTPFIMLICLAGLRSIPDYLYEAAEIDRASAWQKFRHITLPQVMPFLMLAVLFRGIENIKMFDLVVELTSGGPGSATELASIALKRLAFENWWTGYSSALAVILFVTVFGLASIFVRALKRVRER